MNKDDLMTSVDPRMFGPNVTALLGQLMKAAGLEEGPISLGKLEICAAAAMELLTSILANMPEPMRGQAVEGLSKTLATDVAKKHERLERKIPGRRLDEPKGSA
jgi:hypothetical protein